jgi:hypothetical protein
VTCGAINAPLSVPIAVAACLGIEFTPVASIWVDCTEWAETDTGASRLRWEHSASGTTSCRTGDIDGGLDGRVVAVLEFDAVDETDYAKLNA